MKIKTLVEDGILKCASQSCLDCTTSNKAEGCKVAVIPDEEDSEDRESQPVVQLLNVDELKDLFYQIGDFAKICYDSQNGIKHIGKHVIDTNHGSALRSVHFKFHVEGASRAFSHQYVRHSVGVDHNQRSQRYVEEDGFNYITPPSIKKNKVAEVIYVDAMEYLNTIYGDLKALDIPAEDARFVLPNGCETRVNTVFSLQAMIHFMNERLCNRAQWEIRRIASMMKDELEKYVPEILEYMVPKCEQLGYCIEGKKCCGKMPTKAKVLEGYKQYLIMMQAQEGNNGKDILG
jgi:thymidylate synthase (FAD)